LPEHTVHIDFSNYLRKTRQQVSERGRGGESGGQRKRWGETPSPCLGIVMQFDFLIRVGGYNNNKLTKMSWQSL